MIGDRNGPTGALAEASSTVMPWGEDSRVVAALEAYLERIEGPDPPSKEAFLAEYPEIAGRLERCLEGLAFLRGLEPRRGLTVEGIGSGGARLGDFRLLREIGRGGMGVVYEAEQVALGRRVALKVLPMAAALDDRARQRFEIEAQAAARLQHPHIVPIFAVGSERDVPYYAMALIAGRTLAAVIADLVRLRAGDPAAAPLEVPGRGPESARAVARLGIQAAEALEHAHGLGILHRDIKPANLLIDPGGTLWVADFGLARIRGEAGLTLSGDLLGTLRYMSPEQALGRHGIVDERTDVYSLGATLYELATLRPAFDGADRQELLRRVADEEPTPPRRLDPSLPRDLETILLKAIAKEPSGRYATARELAEDLGRFLADQPIRARRPSARDRAAKWVRRHRTAVATAVIVLLLSATVGGALLWNAYQKERDARNRMLEALVLTASASDDLIYKTMGDVSALPGMSELKQGVYRKALAFYERMAELTRPHREPEARRAAVRAEGRIAFTRMLLRDPGTERAYRRAIASYDALLADAPEDPDVLAGLSEALGYYAYQLMAVPGPDPDERLALRRESLRRAAAIERRLARDDPGRLVSLTIDQLALCGVLKASGRADEAEAARRELFATFEAMAVGAGRDPARRAALAGALCPVAMQFQMRGRRPEAERVLRLARDLAPEDPALMNNLAWLLATTPGLPPAEAARAEALAEKAVTLAPQVASFWNTLGAAHIAAGAWPAAVEALDRAVGLQGHGGTAADWFLMAIARRHLGEADEARRLYDRAEAWIDRNGPPDQDLVDLHREAARQLGLPEPGGRSDGSQAKDGGS